MTTEKPDGYVMWKEGYQIELRDCRSKELEAITTRVAPYAKEGWVGDVIEAYQKVLADGWRIRPIKLTFLDEEEK